MIVSQLHSSQQAVFYSDAMMSFVTYFICAYVVLPLLYRGLSHHWYDLCPLAKCIGPLVTCLQEEECKVWLTQVQECNDLHSHRRQLSKSTFAHVQHPEDPAFCRYQCFDDLQTSTALDFLECIGRSGCMAPSQYSDKCITAQEMPRVHLFDNDTDYNTHAESLPLIVHGQWKKLYTTGWDLWPCQWTVFHPPHAADEITPDTWMTQWPQSDTTWRMDLYWTNKNEGNISSSNNLTFHMSNEMYPSESWDFEGQQQQVLPPAATLKTRAIMWGTEAHENWYVLDYDPQLQTLLIYYCAHTAAIDRFDSMAMVLQKYGTDPLTPRDEREMEDKARRLLGDKHGRLQRIEEC